MSVEGNQDKPSEAVNEIELITSVNDQELETVVEPGVGNNPDCDQDPDQVSKSIEDNNQPSIEVEIPVTKSEETSKPELEPEPEQSETDRLEVKIRYPNLAAYLEKISETFEKFQQLESAETCYDWLENCFNQSRKLEAAKLIISKIVAGVTNLSNKNNVELKLPRVMSIVRSDGSYQQIVLVNYCQHNAIFYPLDYWLDKKGSPDTIPYEKGKWFIFLPTEAEIKELQEKHSDQKVFETLQLSD